MLTIHRPPCPELPPECRLLAIIYEKVSRPLKTLREIADVAQMHEATVRSDVRLAKLRLNEAFVADGTEYLRELLESLTRFRGFETPPQVIPSDPGLSLNWLNYLAPAAVLEQKPSPANHVSSTDVPQPEQQEDTPHTPNKQRKISGEDS